MKMVETDPRFKVLSTDKIDDLPMDSFERNLLAPQLKDRGKNLPILAKPPDPPYVPPPPKPDLIKAYGI